MAGHPLAKECEGCPPTIHGCAGGFLARPLPLPSPAERIVSVPRFVPRPLERPSEDLDDAGLVHRCLQGHAAAWQLLVERYGPAVRDGARFTLRRVLGSAQFEDVENVVQGVFLGLCDKNCHRLRLFQARSTFKTWVTAVTARFALNYIRTEKRKGSLKFAALDESAGDLPERERTLNLPADEQEALFRALEKMPPRERLLLKLFYFDGLSYRAIAAAMHMPVNSISPLLARSRESLRGIVVGP